MKDTRTDVQKALDFLNSGAMEGYEAYRELGSDEADEAELNKLIEQIKKAEEDKGKIDNLNSI